MNQFTRRLIAPVSGLFVLAVFISLYIWRREAYFAVLSFIGIAPFRVPFLDFQYILASAQCWQQGVNVYLFDPCDLGARRWDYSPLWLRAWFLPTSDWTNPLGLILVIAFLLSLSGLPPPRERRGLFILLASVLSPRVAFAAERANVDIMIFVLVIAAGVLARDGVMRRLLAYVLVLFAGLLKFYPFLGLAIALRERPKLFGAVAAASIATLAVFVADFHTELAAAIANIPRSTAHMDVYGAVNLPRVMGEVLQLMFAPMLAWFVLLTWTAWRIFHLMRWSEFRQAFTSLPSLEMNFVILGALLIDGSFAAGENIGYRGVFLLLALPGLATLASDTGEVGKFARRTSVLIVFLMWEGILNWWGPIPRFIDAFNPPFGPSVKALLWLTRELIWWQVVGIFASFVLCFALESLARWRMRSAFKAY